MDKEKVDNKDGFRDGNECCEKHSKNVENTGLIVGCLCCCWKKAFVNCFLYSIVVKLKFHANKLCYNVLEILRVSAGCHVSGSGLLRVFIQGDIEHNNILLFIICKF